MWPQRRKLGSHSKAFWDIDFNWIPGSTLTARSLSSGTKCLSREWDFFFYQRWHLVRDGKDTWVPVLEGTEVFAVRFSKPRVERWHGLGWLFWKRSEEETGFSSHVVKFGFNIWPYHNRGLGLVFLTRLCLRIKNHLVSTLRFWCWWSEWGLSVGV